MKAVVLFSGGIDSLAALLYARDHYGPENVTAMYCNLGQRYAEKEMDAVTEICTELVQPFVITNRLFMGDLELPIEQNAIIPYRNSFLILLAASHLPEEGGAVVLQNLVVGETSTWDRRPEFNDSLSQTLDVADPRRIQIVAPWRMKTKTEIVSWIVSSGYAYLLEYTVGCYSNTARNCGHCNSCLRAWVALKNNGLNGIIEARYDKDPSTWFDGITHYIKRFRAGFYSLDREEEFTRALSLAGLSNMWDDATTYVIDIDGVLSHFPSPPAFNMTQEQMQVLYRSSVPDITNICKVNVLYDSGYVIILHTARYEKDRELTEEWLKKAEVKYHRLVMGKPRADKYIDDRNSELQ